MWILGRVRKKKRVDDYELQALRYVVKKGGDAVVEEFKKNFKEVKIEGKRKKASTSSILDRLLVIVFLSQSPKRRNWTPYMWGHRVKQGKDSKGIILSEKIVFR